MGAGASGARRLVLRFATIARAGAGDPAVPSRGVYKTMVMPPVPGCERSTKRTLRSKPGDGATGAAPTHKRRLRSTIVALGLVVCFSAAAQDRQFQLGAVIAEPRSLVATGVTTRSLACEIVCSQFDPRQSIAQIAWPEPAVPVPPQDGGRLVDLRIDIDSGSGSFQDGNFGTIRLSAVPVVEAQPGVGIDLQNVRSTVTPAIVQPVHDSRILARDPALPPADRLMTERIPGALEQLSASERAALERDAQSGGLGRMQVVGQAVELRRSVPHRAVVVEGMQPGLTYEVRLVEDAQPAAQSIAQGICRVPVCPADFIRP